MRKKPAVTAFAMTLAAALVASGCSGGGNGNNASSSPSGSAAPSSSAASPSPSPSGSASSGPDLSKKIKISWHGNFQNEIDPDGLIEQEIEKKFNVDIQYVNANNDKLPLLASSNDMPDVMRLPDPKDVTEYAKAGLLLELPQETLQDQTPNIYEAINAVNPDLWGLTNYEGKNYAIPQYIKYITWDSAIKWRQDILDLAGISSAPQSIAEYDAAFQAIKAKEKDIIQATNPTLKKLYPFSGADMAYTWNQFTWLFGAYGSMPGTWQLDGNGSVVRGELLPSTKDALAKLAEWYKAGYIDPAFVTDKADQYNGKWEKGQYAVNVVNGYISDAVPLKPGAPESPSDVNLKKSVAGASFVWTKAPTGPNGEQGFFSWGPRQNFVALSSRLKDDPDKLARVLDILESVASDEQLWLTGAYGIEGTSYQIGESGLPQFIKPYDDIKSAEAKKMGALGAGSPFAPFADQAVTDKFTDPDVAKTWEALNTDKSDVLFGLPLPSSQEMDQRNSEKWTDTMIKIITGEKPLSAYDDYVKWFNDNGGAKWTQEANDLYNAQFKK
jgi:putative aldouronate transport system substrate-binding protein